MAEEDARQRQRLTPAQKIARHEQAIARLRMQQKRKDRKTETREKIVIGGTILAAMRTDDALRARVSALLAEKVTRDIDREAIAEWLLPTSTQV